MRAGPGVALLTAGAATTGIGYAGTILAGSAPDWAPWALALGTSMASVAMFVLGAARGGIHGRAVGAILILLGVLLLAAFACALTPAPAGEPQLLGLPRRLAVVFYGVGFIPLLVLPVVFARSMPRSGGNDRSDGGPRHGGGAEGE
ncbi:MAG: hypothetical protein IT356_09390 [Gemmatimonadaceae bacterium]|nr:hypothetical protein [Gemmatimonadaceae bacterium]